MKALRTAALVAAAALLALDLASCGRMKRVSVLVGTWTGTPRMVAQGVNMPQKLVLKVSKDETYTMESDSDTVKGNWTLDGNDVTLKAQPNPSGQTVPEMKMKLAPDLHTLRYEGDAPGGKKFAYIFLKAK